MHIFLEYIWGNIALTKLHSVSNRLCGVNLKRGQKECGRSCVLCPVMSRSSSYETSPAKTLSFILKPGIISIARTDTATLKQ